MKKKSLLILPVLLLALAACNKEDDDVIEDDGTVVDPSGDQDTGDGGEDDGGQKEEPIDTRIELAEGARSFTGAESVTYENGAGLSISDPVLVDGAITYYVSGTPNYMDYEQATTFGGANVGDAYIILAISFTEDETLHLGSKTVTYSDENKGVEDLIIGISGHGQGYKEYTVTTGEGESEEVVASYVIDYKGVISIDRRATLSTWSGSLRDNQFTYANPESGLYIDSVAVDEKGNVTYYVKGTASTMTCSGQGNDFGGQAADNDAYIIVTLSLNADETASWLFTDDGSTEQTRSHVANPEEDAETEDVDIIIRISGTGLTGEVQSGLKVFTISETVSEYDADSEVEGVTHTVDFSAVTNSAAATASSTPEA